MTDAPVSGDLLLAQLTALANPHRLRILGALTDGRQYVSELARQIGMGRPLLHMHLRKLEAAGLVTGTMEVSKDGKAMKYYEVPAFSLSVTPEVVAEAVATLSETRDNKESQG